MGAASSTAQTSLEHDWWGSVRDVRGAWHRPGAGSVFGGWVDFVVAVEVVMECVVAVAVVMSSRDGLGSVWSSDVTVWLSSWMLHICETK